METSRFASEAIAPLELQESSSRARSVEMRTRVGELIANGALVFGDEVGVRAPLMFSAAPPTCDQLLALSLDLAASAFLKLPSSGHIHLALASAKRHNRMARIFL